MLTVLSVVSVETATQPVKVHMWPNIGGDVGHGNENPTKVHKSTRLRIAEIYS